MSTIIIIPPPQIYVGGFRSDSSKFDTEAAFGVYGKVSAGVGMSLAAVVDVEAADRFLPQARPRSPRV